MSVTRVVQVQFKKDLSSDEIAKTLEQVRAMKDKCISASNTPYIKSLKIGKDQSSEPLNVTNDVPGAAWSLLTTCRTTSRTNL
ncbi:hypothetical protein LTR10_022453 [Elasticomyces elasticus]|uniref:Stress-response A/B barrel domain-containing protein n=1 Tax=Exophiala sideris TaxID=1016849 RepID=A0ABR0J4E4_9EURO|nr:hypothetical protein LTR10_022453 [Elasticomyces elasticus]KAK5024889.1 hypothetical protein LTS07_008267 [Exophiala sideris]KAK5031521.1 hypothetical protein LTR13_007849 [Exophiala sideris]KAK5054928.1 hypothetical protein LTR69_008496 [Exophiala sideris]KAK5179807.1 hypothetical protein LTR44_007623 [Eurotiomycetes sp. CCFEE 6388]